VVGTDFFLGFMNGLFQIIVYEGHVKFCNLDGICVDVLAGQIATIRDGHQAPDQPGQATPSELTDAAVATSVGTAFAGNEPAHHLTTGQIIALTAAVVIPAIVVPIATRGSRPPVATNPKTIGNGNGPLP
jgi:hypothetical protein